MWNKKDEDFLASMNDANEVLEGLQTKIDFAE